MKSGMLLAFGIIGFLCIVCGIFSQTLLHLIVDDLHIVTEAQKILIFVFLLQLAKIPCQIHMCYLQGTGREKFVLLCTATGTACAVIGILVMGSLAGLAGLYLVIIAEFVALGICYIRQS